MPRSARRNEPPRRPGSHPVVLAAVLIAAAGVAWWLFEAPPWSDVPSDPLAARAAIRDVGRALGLHIPRVDAVVAKVPEQLGIKLKEAIETSDELRKYWVGKVFRGDIFFTAEAREIRKIHNCEIDVRIALSDPGRGVSH